ncbi:MAG: prepilin peptidase [Myxococcota bacterium]
MSGLQTMLVLAVIVTLAAAIWDQQTGLIPNTITYPLLALGAVTHLAITLARFPNASSLIIILEIIAGATLCALVPFLLWRKSAMGGGDVKLLAGLGALLGPSVGLELELYAFLCGVVMAPIVLAYRGQLGATAKRSFALLIRPFSKTKQEPNADKKPLTELRFGPAICLATLLVAFLEWK